MKILHVNYHQSGGGAPRAVMRLHRELLNCGVDSHFLSVEVASGEPEKNVFSVGPARHFYCRVMQRFERQLLRLDCYRGIMPRSLNLFSAGLPALIERENPDLIHLHWIHGAMLSAAELPRLGRPVLWTLHDHWAGCGAEHHHQTGDFRYRTGYGRNAPDFWDSWNFNRKIRLWKDWQFHLVAPSRWLYGQAVESLLLRDRPLRHIANGLNLEVFSPGDRAAARRSLGIDKDETVLMLGSCSVADPNKGGVELMAALECLRKRKPDLAIRLLVPGRGRLVLSSPFPVLQTGFILSEESMAELYRATDVVLLGSKFDNLPNMLTECAACATPAVAFAVGGCPDTIRHRESGYLAEPFDPADFAAGIELALEHRDEWGGNARKLAEENFDVRKAVRQYIEFYREILKWKR